MHDRAGTTARPEDLIDLDALLGAHDTTRPATAASNTIPPPAVRPEATALAG